MPNPRDREESASSRVLDTLAEDTERDGKMDAEEGTPLSLRDTINPLEVDGGTMLIPRKKKKEKKKEEKKREKKEEKEKEVHLFLSWLLMRAKTLNRS